MVLYRLLCTIDEKTPKDFDQLPRSQTTITNSPLEPLIHSLPARILKPIPK
jgi:hypothetical protein